MIGQAMTMSLQSTISKRSIFILGLTSCLAVETAKDTKSSSRKTGPVEEERVCPICRCTESELKGIIKPDPDGCLWLWRDLVCGHYVCQTCYRNPILWHNPRCPLCRKPFPEAELMKKREQSYDALEQERNAIYDNAAYYKDLADFYKRKLEDAHTQFDHLQNECDRLGKVCFDEGYQQALLETHASAAAAAPASRQSYTCPSPAFMAIPAPVDQPGEEYPYSFEVCIRSRGFLIRPNGKTQTFTLNRRKGWKKKWASNPFFDNKKMRYVLKFEKGAWTLNCQSGSKKGKWYKPMKKHFVARSENTTEPPHKVKWKNSKGDDCTDSLNFRVMS